MSAGMRARSRWALLLSGGLLAPSTLLGQDAAVPPDTARTSSGDGGRVGCIQGAPPPECSTFWLVELQASTALIAPSYELGSPDFRYRHSAGQTLYEWNVGHMANLDDRWAVGGTVSLGNGAHEIFTGARGRLRHWLGESVSLELEVGLVRGNGSNAWYPDETGISTGLRFNIQDYGSAFLRYDGYGEPGRYPGALDQPEPDLGSQHFLRGGVGLGGKAALSGTGVVVAVYAVLYAIFLGSGGWT